MDLVDFLDPNTWVKEEHEHRIYGDDREGIYAVVDEIDYQYLVQWRWKPKESRKHKGTKNPKVYLCRAESELFGADVYEDGKRIRQRCTRTVYLHTVVMQRKGVPLPTTNKRIITDHANGNGLDCTRDNLRYTTLSFNNKNLFGCLENELL